MSTSTVSDIAITCDTVLSVEEIAQAPVDLFERQGIINRILMLLDLVSKKQTSCTIALSGAWGTGKTFVLNRLMKQLLEYQDGEKYFVFHYNCWQYDYYEEPLIAIVAAMLDSIDEETHLFSASLRQKAKDGFALAKPILQKIATDFVQKKIGVDITDILSLLKDCTGDSKTVGGHEYDKYYAFKKAILSAQTGIRSLSEQRTVVVVVDELDRCLPQYAIKVLERLHHLFAGLKNSAVILGIDKGQLNHTIEQIFGSGTQSNKYLEKFIDYEFPLDIGKISCGFKEKYADYFSMFDETLIETEFSFEAFIAALFAGIDIRTQEHLMTRIKTVHTMLFSDSRKDYSFAFFELMWIVLSDVYNLVTQIPIVCRIQGEAFTLQVLDDAMPEFSAYIKNNWSHLVLDFSRQPNSTKRSAWLNGLNDIPQMLLWYLSQMYANHQYYRVNNEPPLNSNFNQNVKDLKYVVKLLDILK